jgi:pimeloyl-ACP methyl ester carboxylesterase
MEYKYIDIDGIKVAYIEEGEGFPMFFIPPWASSSIAFEGVTKLLLKESENIKVIRVDLPGWGGKTKGRMESNDFQAYVDIVAKFINSFGYLDYGVLGYSLGATFLLHAIEQGKIHPNKTVIVSGFHGRTNIVDVDSRLRSNFYRVQKLIDLKIPSPVVKLLIGLIYFSELVTISLYRKHAVYYIRLISKAINGDLRSAFNPMMTLKDLNAEMVKRNKGKVMVLYNSNEPWYFQQFNKEIAQMLDTEPVCIEAYSHRHFSFEPERSYRVIKDFISK